MTLKNELDRFGQLFKRHLNDSMKATLRWVSPTEVDWEAQTMTAVDGDGLEFFDVLLGVGTTAVKPVVGCDCLIAIVEGDESTAFMLYADEAEEVLINAEKMEYHSDLIQYNAGENGGLVKVGPMADWMKKVSSDLQTLKTLLLSSTVAGNGAPLAISFNPQTPVPKKEDFENEKIKH